MALSDPGRPAEIVAGLSGLEGRPRILLCALRDVFVPFVVSLFCLGVRAMTRATNMVYTLGTINP